MFFRGLVHGLFQLCSASSAAIFSRSPTPPSSTSIPVTNSSVFSYNFRSIEVQKVDPGTGTDQQVWRVWRPDHWVTK
jgi:hypothetical protein